RQLALEVELGDAAAGALGRHAAAPGGPYPALALALAGVAALGRLLRADAAHPLHDLLHLAELGEQGGHVGRLHARALGDALPAGRVDEVGVAALGERHRVDHRLDAAQLAVVDLGVA